MTAHLTEADIAGLEAHFDIPAGSLRRMPFSVADGLHYARRKGMTVRLVGRTWRVADPTNPGNVVMYAAGWLSAPELRRLRRKDSD